MIVFDVIIVLVLILALVAGIRRGFFSSIGTLAGLAAGAFAASWLAPLVSNMVPSPAWRTVAVIATVLGLLFGGGALGAWLGSLLRSGADRLKLRWAERLLGGIASVIAAVLALALVAPTLVTSGIPGVSAVVGSSYVVNAIKNVVPPPVEAALAELRSSVFADGIPRLGELLGPSRATPNAPPVALDDPALATAAASVARVSGTAYACGRGATGSGFVIAPDRIVTNAHVVAGVDLPLVELPGRPAREGRIVYFDEVVDLAVIAVDDLGATPLPRAETLPAGSSAAVQGYPFGGPFTMTNAFVLDTGTAMIPDIYDRTSNPREIYSLESVVRPGNSGGPVLTADGRVAGVVFARAENKENLGYAMTMKELGPVAELASSATERISSGDCVG